MRSQNTEIFADVKKRLIEHGHIGSEDAEFSLDDFIADAIKKIHTAMDDAKAAAANTN